MGKSCANFVAQDDFATRLNDSLKEYFKSFDGYSADSLWSTIKDSKEKITLELQMEPYMPGSQDAALQNIIECAAGIQAFISSLNKENHAVYDYAYTYKTDIIFCLK